MSNTTNLTANITADDKPRSVKALQILIIVRLLLVLVFFVVFSVKDITIGTVGPQIILYTFIAFAVMAVILFYFIRKRNMQALRIALVVDLLAAIPASAFISIAFSLVEIGLTFSKTAKAYFNRQ